MAGWLRRLVMGLGIALLVIAADASASARWGVLTSKQLQTSGVADLLTVKMSEIDNLELVERDDVEKALREQELAALVQHADAAKRIQIGRLVRAQRLLVIDGSYRNKHAELHVVVDDTVIGARLFDEKIEIASAEPETLCSTVVAVVEETQRRFPEGLRSAIAIPYFVSKSLEHDYDHFQKEWADLLGQSLTRAAGIAVVSLDELQNIRREMALTNSGIERFVPLQINGEYTIGSGREDASPRVELSVRLSDGATTFDILKYEDVRLQDVRALLTDAVSKRVFARLGDDAVRPMSLEAQQQALAARAQRFAEYGAFHMAVKLREAILLLEPDNVEQRIALLEDDKASRSMPSLEFSFPHIEYLLRNRLVDLPLAYQLIRMHSIGQSYVRPPAQSLPLHLYDHYGYFITLAELAVRLPCAESVTAGNSSLDTARGVPQGKYPGSPADQYREFLGFLGNLTAHPANEWHQKRKLDDLLRIYHQVPDFDGLFPLVPEIVTSGRFSKAQITRFCKGLRATGKSGQVQLADFLELHLQVQETPDRIGSAELAKVDELEKTVLGFCNRQDRSFWTAYWFTAKQVAELKTRLVAIARENKQKTAGGTATVLKPPVFQASSVQHRPGPSLPPGISLALRNIREHGGQVGYPFEIVAPNLFADQSVSGLAGMVVCLSKEWKGGDDGMKAIGSLDKVRMLFVIDAPVSDAGMRHISNVPNELYLANTQITEAGLEHFDFSRLTVLWLEDATGKYLNDDTLKVFANARNLRYVGLAGPGFTEVARRRLAPLQALKEVRIVNEMGTVAVSTPHVDNPVTEPPEPTLEEDRRPTIQMIKDWQYPVAPQSWRFPAVHVDTHQPNVDLAWDVQGVHLLECNSNGALKFNTFYPPDFENRIAKPGTVLRARSDGHNIWLATADGVIVTSPLGERLATFTKDEGLPPFTSEHQVLPGTVDASGVLPTNGTYHHDSGNAWSEGRYWHELQSVGNAALSVFPVGERKCLAFGRFDSLGRTWIALLSLDEGKATVRVLHSAVRMLQADEYDDPEMLASPQQMDLIFNIPWICLYKDPRDPNLAVAVFGRVHDAASGSVANTPLAVDLETFKVTTLPERVPGLKDIRGGTAVECIQGALVLGDWGRLEVFVPQSGGDFQRITIAEEATQNLFLFRSKGSVYSPGLKWYRIGPPKPGERGSDSGNSSGSRALNQQLVAEEIAADTIPRQHTLNRYSESSLFGVWAMRNDGTAAYEIDPEKSTRQRISPFAGIVPEERLQKHDEAVKAIRDLGGYVDRSSRCRSVLPLRRNWYPGTTVVCLTKEWRGGDEGLRHLKGLHGLAHLYLLEAPVTDEGMKYLSGLGELETLVLSGTPIGKEGLRHLDLRRLRTAFLDDLSGGRMYTDEILSSLSNCGHLRNMILCGRGFTERAVPYLAVIRTPDLAVRTIDTLIPERCADVPTEAIHFEGTLTPNDVVDAALRQKMLGEPTKADSAGLQMVFLGGEDPCSKDRRNQGRREHSSIAIEAFRQAVLIAARDELGAVTRDYWLGESVTDDDLALRLELDWLIENHAEAVQCGFRGTHPDGEVVEESFKQKVYSTHELASLIDFFDKSSRSLFVTALKQQGVQGQSVPWRERADVPDDVKELLARPTFPAQYAAVRELHRIIQAEGESPERLAALAWGYVHLGYLTESTLHPMNEVFKLRAVLYAKRLEDKAGGNDYGRGISKAVLALVGLHEAALNDHGPVGENPVWLALGEPYCTYDFAELERLRKQPEISDWAELFAFNALMYTGREDQARNQQAELLDKFPQCQRFWTLQTYGPMLQPVPAQELATRQFGVSVYEEIGCVPDLPDRAAEIVAQGQSVVQGAKPGSGAPDAEFPIRRRLIDELAVPDRVDTSQPESREMSLQVLGAWIREVSFSQVLLRTYYLHISGWGGGNSQTIRSWIKKTEPLTSGHSWRAFLDMYQGGQEAERAAQEFPNAPAERHSLVHHLTPNDRPLWYGCRESQAALMYAEAEDFFDAYRCEEDIRHVYHGLMPRVYFAAPGGRRSVGREFECSPWNPWFALYSLSQNPLLSDVRPQVDKWWDHFADDVEIRRAIALWHARVNEYEKAAERLEAVYEVVPDFEVCRALANAYEETEEESKASEVTLAFLSQQQAVTEQGAQLAFDRAVNAMADEDVPRALAWLDRGLESGSDWGLFCRSLAAELRGNWDEAVKTARRFGTMRPGNCIHAYWILLRCGAEDRHEMATHVSEYRDSLGFEIRNYDKPDDRAHIHMILGLEQAESPDTIAESFLKIDVKGRGRPYQALHALLLAVEHDLSDIKSQLLSGVKLQEPQTTLSNVFQRLIEAESSGEYGISDEEFEELMESASASDQVDAGYFFAKYLAVHGERDRAYAHWRRVASLPLLTKINRTLAIYELRKLGMTDEEYRGLSGVGQ